MPTFRLENLDPSMSPVGCLERRCTLGMTLGLPAGSDVFATISDTASGESKCHRVCVYGVRNAGVLRCSSCWVCRCIGCGCAWLYATGTRRLHRLSGACGMLGTGSDGAAALRWNGPADERPRCGRPAVGGGAGRRGAGAGAGAYLASRAGAACGRGRNGSTGTGRSGDGGLGVSPSGASRRRSGSASGPWRGRWRRGASDGLDRAALARPSSAWGGRVPRRDPPGVL